ncbi:MAG: exo-alpha-sialidase, partial [Azonexus sp.]|nr:exo-alpha-sialidase [Azonexus sp.]
MPALPRWLSAALFAAALGAAWWRIPDWPTPVREPLPPPRIAVQPLPEMSEPTLARLPDGRIAAAWTAAGDEAGATVIHFSLFAPGGWTAPRVIASRETAAGGLFAHIRRVEKPQLYVEGSWLHLWFAAIGVGGSANITLAHSVSTDAGGHWTAPERLPTSPLAGYSLAPDGPPLPLADGGLLLPLRNALADERIWLRLTANGRVAGRLRHGVLFSPDEGDAPKSPSPLVGEGLGRGVWAQPDASPLSLFPWRVRPAWLTRSGGAKQCFAKPRPHPARGEG